jgi:uncharacterized protein YceK
MAFRVMCVALLLASLPLAGCGTVANLTQSRPELGGKTPFGGVRQDLDCYDRASRGEVSLRAHHKSDSEQYSRRALMLFCAADLPFSFIGDLLTWPYAVSYSCVNQPSPVPPVIITDPPVTQAMPAAIDIPPMPISEPPKTPPMKIPLPPKTQSTGDGKIQPSP